MASLELINNSIELAKELSLDLETRSRLPSERDIIEAVHVMNQYLYGVHGNVSALLRADQAYLDLPDEPFEWEILPDASLEKSKIEQAIMRGKIHSFRWLGSTSLSAFGVQLYGVDVLAPKKTRSRNAFVPVESVSVQLAA